MRQLDLTYRRQFSMGGHIELQIHADLDLLAGDVEWYVVDLAMQALTGRGVADHVAEAVNRAGDVPPEQTEPSIVHEPAGDDAGISGPPPDREPAVADLPEPPFRIAPAVEGHRRVFTDTMKRRAVEYSDRVGIAAAAGQLGIHASQLRTWRTTLRPTPVDLQTQAGQERRANHTKPAVGVAQKRATAAATEGTAAPVTEREDAGSSAPAPDGTITAPTDDPAWPCKCSCARRFPTITDWREHRKGINQTSWKLHRLVEQPKAAMVDSGIPHPKPPGRDHVPDVAVIDPHSSLIGAAR